MQKFGLNALEKTLRAGSSAVKIDRHCETLLEEEL
jgi:hypothetical protein